MQRISCSDGMSFLSRRNTKKKKTDILEFGREREGRTSLYFYSLQCKNLFLYGKIIPYILSE
jgi:hypothetical protein